MQESRSIIAHWDWGDLQSTDYCAAYRMQSTDPPLQGMEDVVGLGVVVLLTCHYTSSVAFSEFIWLFD